MGKIILTDNIVADARDKGFSINEMMRKTYEGEIADLVKSHPEFKDLSPLEMAMYDAGLTKHHKIKDFYTTNNNDLLFPALIDQRIAETVAKDPMIRYVVGSDQTIDATSVKALTLGLTTEENKKALKKRDIVEGSDLPSVKISVGSKAISLFKRGVAVEATYESLRHTPLDLFLKTISAIGKNSAHQQMDDAINVLVNGDGNNNAPTVDTAAGSALTADDLILFALNFYDDTNGMVLDTLIAGQSLYLALTKMVVEINRSNTYKLGASFNFPQHAFGDLTVIYDNRVPAATGGKAQLIGLNRDNALTRYIEAGSIINEIDQNIRNQTKIGTMSETVGFAKFVKNASRVLKLA